MNSRSSVCLLLIYTIWSNLFAPFALAQNILPLVSASNVGQSKPDGLQFRVREAARQAEKPKLSEPAPTQNLSESETNAILKRLPALKSDEADKADFALRTTTLPPPKTGNIISTKFPAAAESQNAPDITNANSAALEVVRFSPEGDEPLVSDLSVTFSQPMIALSEQTQAEQTVLVKLTPAVKGRWRWLGTKTLVFDAETRFPMATKFTATIPAGTKSAVGGRLQKEISWTFSTSPPKIEKFAPDNQNRQAISRDVLMAASFNQEIDANAVLSKMNVTANGKPIAIRLATEDEAPANISIQSLGDAQPKYWIAFRAVDLLPLDSEINITFEKGLPSAEGNLTSTMLQEFSFRTYGAFKFVKSSCGYDDNERDCQQSETFTLKFNNSLYPIKLDSTQVKIEPNLENARVYANGEYIYIEGEKKGRTTYKVTVSDSLKDWFGQTLGSDVSAIFNVGSQPPRFFAQGGDFVTLDPNAKPTFSVYSLNQPSLKVKLYAVTPEDYLSFREMLQTFRNNGRITPTPDFGRLVFDQIIETKSTPDELTETRIDMSPALLNGFGQAILIVEPTVKNKQYDYYNQDVIVWTQSTNIGLDAFSDYEKLTTFTTDLKNGKPISNVQITMFNGGNAVSDESGLANFEFTTTNDRGRFLVARNGNDTALLSEGADYETSWTLRNPPAFSRWFVFDDREMYRPNEEVSIKGYIRKITGGKLSDVTQLGNDISNVNYVLKDPRGNELLKGTANLNAFGAFDFKFKLPDNISLGYQHLELTTSKDSYQREYEHTFQVQEFRRPEFEVSLNAENAAPFFVGNSATINVEAKYYSGGFLTNAQTNWRVYASQTNYTPPNRNDFNFGTFIPWWISVEDSSRDFKSYNPASSQSFTGVTGADGKHRIAVDFVAANPARPYRLTANASIQDVNRQTLADTMSLLVHPSELYVGIRTPKAFVRQGESFKVETITTNLDGKAAANRDVTINAVLKDYERTGGPWQEVIVDTKSCMVKSDNDPVSCDFTAKQGGVFTITASVADDRGRRNESETMLWVAGGNTAPKRTTEQEKAELIPDKKDYAPNSTAEILVNSPFVPAEGVLTLRRNGIIKTERFTMNEPSTVLHFPIEERYLPNINVHVDLVGATERTNEAGEIDKNLPKRPAFASGELNLKVSTASRKLNVLAEPVSKTLEPGGSTNINVQVKDNNGNAVTNSEVAVVVVDESVLALTNYSIPNPLDAFYQNIAEGVIDYHSRAGVLLNNPSNTILAKQFEIMSLNARSMSIMDSVLVDGSRRGDEKRAYKEWVSKDVALITTEREKQQINMRRNFNALATFTPSVVTNADGRATVKVKLPDNLTRYRVTAVAVTNSKQFGLGESAITAKQSLQVRPSAPRFMNFGDRIELPVVVQNQTDNSMTVDVAMRAANANLTDGNGRKVTIAANDRAEIRFPVSADRAGAARFQIAAVAGKFADAAEIELPVYTPATTETFATYGTTDKDEAIVQPIAAPSDVFPQFGGLELTTSSTQLQELTDAYIYLQNYPFECSEQISSRIISTAALRDVLTAFDAKDLPSKWEIEAKMRSGIEHLQKLQHADGGFSFWRSDDESLPFVSVHVAHALARAKAKGYNVPPETLVKLNAYLKAIETKYPAWYSQETKWAISAYALYVRDLLGEKDANAARKLLQDAPLEKLSLESVGWVLSVLANDKDSAAEIEILKRHLLNRATETAGASHFVTNYKDGEYVLLSSDRRADAVILEALLKIEPSNDLVPKIVRGLLANKTKGHWSNTQENVFVLLALDQYFQTYEKQTPNFVARVWLGQTFAGEQQFAGRSVDSNLTRVPMKYLQQQSNSNLILDKAGSGRLYYRIGLNYAARNLNTAAADEGFAVTRMYEAVDDANDVKQQADGNWIIKAGARVLVKIQMVAPTRRYHVALVDKLPAGLEIINPELAVSEVLPVEKLTNAPGNRNSYYARNWFEHQNLRDERAEAFTSLLPEGVWSYSYVARATTPGQFVVPPAAAEEMYMPETFGRSKTDFVRVE